MFSRLATLVVFAMFGVNFARAVDYHVATAQQLQNALTLAAATSVSNNIYVTNGYYTGNFNFNSANVNSLTIQAETNVASSQIVIDSGGTGSSMSITASASPSITVQGMTFLRNCGSPTIGGLQVAGGNTAILVSDCQFISPTNSSGMGLNIVSGLNATVTNCTAIGSLTGNGGTGISISGVPSNAIVQNCTLNTNVSANPYSYGYSFSVGLSISGAANVAVINSLFRGNSSINGSAGGAGADCSGTTINLSGNTFIGNTIGLLGGRAASCGGGAYCSGTIINLIGNTFASNLASGGSQSEGGGACCYGTTINLLGNIFASNSANNGEYQSWGGGAYCNGPTVNLSGNAFTSNSAINGNSQSAGGGAYAYCNGTGNITFSNNVFTGNLAFTSNAGLGGGAYCVSYVTNPVTFFGNTIQQNSAVSGGGLYTSAPTINLLDNLVLNNVGTNNSSEGGGIWVDASATLNMINNTVTGNTSAGSGGGAAYIVTGTVELLNVYNNIIWGNLATAGGGDVYLTGTGKTKVFDFNDVNDMAAIWDVAVNNTNVAPQFVYATSGDYHLQGTSPCANVGTNGAPSQPLTDLDGNSRTDSAGLIDLGCYEFNTTATHPADTNADFVMTASEYNAYAAAWKAGQTWTNGPYPGPNPMLANYVTRAGYLAFTNSGHYTNTGSARPTNWRPAAQ